MITYKIHLIRHGRTAESADGLYLGRTDLPLSAAGKQGLLDKAAQFVYPPAQIVYTSPLQRCVQTAALLYPERMTISLDALNECDFGAFTGKSFAQLKELPVYQKWVEGGFEAAPPDGESGMELLSRVLAGIQEIFSRMMAERLTDVAVVTHGGVIMSLLAACGFPKREMRQWITDLVWIKNSPMTLIFWTAPFMERTGLKTNFSFEMVIHQRRIRYENLYSFRSRPGR